jgi:hypothetical protein
MLLSLELGDRSGLRLDFRLGARLPWLESDFCLVFLFLSLSGELTDESEELGLECEGDCSALWP